MMFDAKPQSWMERGECARVGKDGKPVHDPELWFDAPEQLGHLNLSRAHTLCAICPVRQQCFDYAEQEFIRSGIWGGVSFRDGGKRERRRAFKSLPDRVRRYWEWRFLPPKERKERTRIAAESGKRSRAYRERLKRERAERVAGSGPGSNEWRAEVQHMNVLDEGQARKSDQSNERHAA